MGRTGVPVLKDGHGREVSQVRISLTDSCSFDCVYCHIGVMVEIVDPVENTDFCNNCHRVRVTHDGKLKGCLNRTDDLRSMGEMTRDEIRETFRETVANRVPYYSEYAVRNDDGEWVVNEECIERTLTEVH